MKACLYIFIYINGFLADPYQFDRLFNALNLSLKSNLIWRALRDLNSLS